jgi:hypothetical protein
MQLILRLSNSAADVDNVARLMHRTNARVFAENARTMVAIDDLVDPALDLADPKNASTVWQRAHELAAIVTGAAKVEGIAAEVELDNLMYIDDAGERRPMPITGEAHIFLPALRTGDPPPPDRFVLLALRDSAAAKVLRLHSRAGTWINLYRILEAISDDTPEREMVANGWASRAEIDAFTASANHVAVTGDQSRHGKSSGTPPRRTMSHHQAQNLIGRIVAAWLNDR